MKNFLNRLRDFIGFSICMFIFPSAIINLARFLKIEGKNNTMDKFFLYLVSKDLPVKGDILEIGSFMGSSSIFLVAGNAWSKRKGKVWLIEPNPKPNKETFMDIFRRHNLDRTVELIAKTSEDARREVNAQFRFIFIDGNHGYEFVKKDILLWGECLKEGGIIAFHDRNHSGVARALDELICKSDKFTLIATLGSIFYACKGNYVDNGLFLRLRRLSCVSKICTAMSGSITKRFGV